MLATAGAAAAVPYPPWATSTTTTYSGSLPAWLVGPNPTNQALGARAVVFDTSAVPVLPAIGNDCVSLYGNLASWLNVVCAVPRVVLTTPRKPFIMAA